MGRILLVLAIAWVGVCISAVWSDHVLPVVQCEGQNFENLKERVHVTPCGKKYCKLPKGSNATVTLRFKPTKDVSNPTAAVQGVIATIPLPFVGVNGNTACGKIVNADTGEPASCPLKADVEYLYTNSFPIETFYPTVEVTVHWALKDGDKDLICFEVPAKIVDAKKH